ncbi:MAG: mechanosensitive ion channel family protein [Planctomycetota bacterium]|jgi:small-conductance mechanosensitive channel
MPPFGEWSRIGAALQILLIWVGAAVLVRIVLSRGILRLTRWTRTEVDNVIVTILRPPLFWTMLFAGLHFASRRYAAAAPPELTLLDKCLLTLAVYLWARAVMRISDTVLDALARRADEYTWIEPRSLALYEIGAKVLALGGAVYLVMVAWRIDVSAWLASAGILGIAVGFAARDTLANLFAGVFILADAPYKIGDFIVLDSGERGRVTDIGVRSTRLLTRDDVEITLPNAVIANAKITNETGGPTRQTRVRVSVGVAYGSDIDHVRTVLEEVARECEAIAAYPAPHVRFREMGESALIFQVRGWVTEPVLVGRAIDQLNTTIYQRFAGEGIEIPFPQRVVHLRRKD